MKIKTKQWYTSMLVVSVHLLFIPVLLPPVNEKGKKKPNHREHKKETV